jgi:hypothetical protein
MIGLFHLLLVELKLDGFEVLVFAEGVTLSDFNGCLLLLQYDLLLLYLLPNGYSVLVELQLLSLFLDFELASLLYLFVKFFYSPHMVDNVLLVGLSLFKQILVSLTDTFELLFLLFFGLHKVFKLLSKKLKGLLLSKLNVSLSLNLECSDLATQTSYLFSLLFFLVSLVLDLFIGLAHLSLKPTDPLDFA